MKKKFKISYKSVFAILFSVIVIGFFVTIGERFVRFAVFKQFVDGMLQTETEISDTDVERTDWSKIYPLSEDDKKSEEPEEVPEQPGRIETMLNSYKKLVSDTESGIEYYTSKLLFLRMNFIELNAKFNKLIGMKLISGSDNIVYLADGNLSYYPTDADVTKGAENLTELADFAKKNGAEFLYVQAPSKLDPDNNYLPGGIEDTENESADELLDILDGNGVDYLDLRNSMKQQNMNYTKSFYRTDHHWKAGVALWASRQIAGRLKENGLSCDLSKVDINNYDETVYEDYMLGSLGRQVTLAYTDPEDISIYTPKFKTEFTVDYYDSQKLHGDFKESMLDMSVLEKKDYYNVSTYAAYFYGIDALTHVENNMADNDKRALLICDSFGNSVAPFLSTQVKTLDRMDLRYYNGGVKSFIEKNKPDIVIVLYYPGSFVDCDKVSMCFR